MTPYDATFVWAVTTWWSTVRLNHLLDWTSIHIKEINEREGKLNWRSRQGSASSAAPYTGPALRGPRGKASNSHQRQSRDAPTAANSGTVEEIRERQCIPQREVDD
ncbi:uncharacterized protein LOC142768614 [Rhipicephalus microplus]|uniref:uncharacterized protein LOC142768614 n=1 Tax=Rhipicephalus microplus TaxID=6941 RepID=UPI003F6B1DB7